MNYISKSSVSSHVFAHINLVMILIITTVICVHRLIALYKITTKIMKLLQTFCYLMIAHDVHTHQCTEILF